MSLPPAAPSPGPSASGAPPTGPFPDPATGSAAAARVVPLEALRVWCRVAALSFGGPAGQIAVMQRILVEEKRWVSQERFLHALSYCMLLPGPEAQQLAIYLGWLLHGTRAGVLAGTLFVLPGFLSILGLSLLYVLHGDSALLAGVFYGLKPAVLAVVVHAIGRLARRAFAGRPVAARRAGWAIAGAAFVLVSLAVVPFPAVVLGAALAGWWLGGRTAPETPADEPAPTALARSTAEERRPIDDAADAAPPPRSAALRHTLRTAALWLLVWWLPVAALVWWLGRDSVLVEEALFFSQAAVVTFGGAYAVLAYIGQRAVEGFGWLSATEMLDGLGLAETTPGPLIQVVQFVGFLAAWRHPGELSPLAAALLGSLVTTWVTFAPSFLFVLAGAPWIERLRGRRALADALGGITAAVVGVVLSLALWFGLHTLFAELRALPLPAGRLLLPQWGTLDPSALGLALGAAWALYRTRLGLLPVLALAVLAGTLLHAL